MQNDLKYNDFKSFYKIVDPEGFEPSSKHGIR